jgi:hypothetical protein
VSKLGLVWEFCIGKFYILKDLYDMFEGTDSVFITLEKKLAEENGICECLYGYWPEPCMHSPPQRLCSLFFICSSSRVG